MYLVIEFEGGWLTDNEIRPDPTGASGSFPFVLVIIPRFVWLLRKYLSIKLHCSILLIVIKSKKNKTEDKTHNSFITNKKNLSILALHWSNIFSSLFLCFLNPTSNQNKDSFFVFFLMLQELLVILFKSKKRQYKRLLTGPLTKIIIWVTWMGTSLSWKISDLTQSNFFIYTNTI